MHFTAPIESGVRFHMSDWPLHVTIADVFAIDRTGSMIDMKLASLLSEIKAVEVIAVSDELLGETPVVLLEKIQRLQKLHDSIATLLKENGAIFNNPEFTYDGFLPHSTIQKSGRLHIGDKITIDSVSLIDMFPGGDWQQRKVLMTFKLGA